MGNLTKEYYMDVIDYYRPDYRERILNGEYPMHLAKGDGYEIHWVNESEITEYSIFNCPDEHFLERKSGQYFGWPITWHPNVYHSIEAKIEDGRPLNVRAPFPDWTGWISE
jgi:hypothetical protein